MSRCTACAVRIEGTWETCPLCGASTVGAGAPSPFPSVPLPYSWARLLRMLLLVSLGVIAVSLAAQLLLGRGAELFGAARSVWLGICTMWLVVLAAVRARRRVARSTLWTVALVCALSAYWDYLTGWHRWSLSYAIPIVAASAIIALLIIVRAMRLEPGEHVLSSALMVLLGLVPLVLLMLGQVPVRLPSGICGAIAVASLVRLAWVRGADLRHELARRLHL